MRIKANLVAGVRTRFIILWFFWGLQPVFFGSSALAATINVAAGQSIQAAINVAAAGDEIIVAPGTYFETIDFLGKAIALRSSGGPLVTVIDGSGAGGSVVQCVNAEGPGTVLEGFTITGGNADTGGGMRNVGSSPTINECIAAGDEMRNVGSSPTINECRKYRGRPGRRHVQPGRESHHHRLHL